MFSTNTNTAQIGFFVATSTTVAAFAASTGVNDRRLVSGLPR
jgi:hypothetical protein